MTEFNYVPEVVYLELTTVYVALVLKKAREWFMREHAKIYEGVDIYWHLNIGMPVKNFDEKEIKENFQRMAIGAWWLSMKEFPIILDQATGLKRLVSNKDFNPGVHRDYINVVPEVAAQVAGYARSQLREEGLHMLVDIGASTMDTATFLLNKEQGDDRYVFMTARIERVGCLELHFRRLDIIEDYLEKWVKECKECFDITSPIPRFPDGYHPELERLKDLDEEFLKDVCHPVRGTVALTKTNRDPNSEKWVEGLPIFLCGGGSQVEFYNPKMIKRVEEELTKNFKWNGFRQSTIPKPENLKAESLHSRDYHRLSVAYGLSFPIDDIGKIVPPSEVDDIKKQPRVREYEFISKDQV